MSYRHKGYDILQALTASKAPKLFVTPKSSIALTEPSFLILSPHYYYAQPSQVAFKSTAQAKKVAASLFMSTLSEKKRQNLHYVVQKNGTQNYTFIAYDPQSIKERLIAQGADTKLIKGIYFAQSYFFPCQEPIGVSQKEGLICVEGIWVMLESCYIDAPLKPLRPFLEKTPKEAKSIAVPGLRGFDLLSYKWPLAAALILTVSLFALKELSLSRSLALWEHKHIALKKSYKLPQTSFELNSIMKSLNKKAKAQNFIREKLYKVSKMRHDFKGTLQSIQARGDRFKLSAAPNETLYVKLKKAFKKARFTQNEQSLTLELRR